MLLLDLPDCMLEQVFEYLSYDEMTKKRLVSKKINKVCETLLNIGFNKMMKRHTYNLKKIKTQLPRRESERRVHVLAKHADILTCVETRISMLSMTYSKYIDLGLCCFIPGKIIDEVMAILQLVESTNKPLRSHEVLQELRDISSMAIDHFDEHIVPNLKKAFCELSKQKYGTGSSVYQQLMQSSTSDGGLPDVNEMLQAPNPNAAAHRCNEQMCNRLLISRLDRRCESIMKLIQQILTIQKRQATRIRTNTLQISELRSQMTECRRHMEDFTGKRMPDVSTPLTHYVSSASNSSSESIEVLGSSPTSSGSASSVTVSPNAPPYSYLATVSGRSSYKSTKPRTATVMIKRHLEEASELCQSAAKIARLQDDEEDSD